MCTNFQTKRTTLNFWAQIRPKWNLRSEFHKSKSGFEINTSNIPCVPIFSQNGIPLIFWPKFGEIAQLRAISWFKYCWGCCRELGGGWNKLGGGRWSWVEVGAQFRIPHLNYFLHEIPEKRPHTIIISLKWQTNSQLTFLITITLTLIEKNYF